MPFIDHDGARHYVRHEGQDDRPVLLLAHALGLDHGMWDAQVAALIPAFRILRYDLRGHGASLAPGGDYTIDALGRDALAIADGAGVERFAFCGLSLGGMIGLWIATHAPERLTHLVLANTTARVSVPGDMQTRRDAVLRGGMEAVVETALGRFFSPGGASAAAVDWARRTLRATDPAGYAGCCAAIRDMDQRASLGGVAIPTLVIAGDRDVSMPWTDHAGVLAREIPHARVVRLRAAHVSNLERPRDFSAALLEFLLPPADGTIERGEAVRRKVLGDAHVDRAAAGSTPFTHDFQELITRVAWGAIWARPALDRRTRRLLVLTATAALGRWEEFRLHVRAGLEGGGLELSDLKETLLQVAVYAGVPAGNTAFQVAAEEIGKHER